MVRVQFKKGEQRKFFQEVMIKINCPSLKELSNRISVNYSTLKNYFSEKRFISKEFFEDLCFVSKQNCDNFEVNFVEDSWGQVKGGKKK